MKKLLLHKISGFLLALLCGVPAMLSSCGNDVPPAPGEQTEAGYEVCVRISAGEQFSTRGSLPEEFGTNLENKIDLSDLRILIFDKKNDNKLIDILLDSNLESGKDATLLPLGFGDYVLKAKLSPEKYNLESEFSIAVLANWTSLMENDDLKLELGETSLTDLKNKTFRLNPDVTSADTSAESWFPVDRTSAADASLIPMFGILYSSLRGYTASIFNEGNPMDLGTVNLLRSLTKIEIVDNTGAEDNRAVVDSIILKSRNTRGYLDHYISDGVNTQQVINPHIPDNAIYSGNRLRFRKENNKFVAYVPEMDMGYSMDSRKSIDVYFSYAFEEFGIRHETRSIYLAPYEDGKPYIPSGSWPYEWRSLLRNHIYRFSINSINASELDLTVDVKPYAIVRLEPEFGLN